MIDDNLKKKLCEGYLSQFSHHRLSHTGQKLRKLDQSNIKLETKICPLSDIKPTEKPEYKQQSDRRFI